MKYYCRYSEDGSNGRRSKTALLAKPRLRRGIKTPPLILLDSVLHSYLSNCSTKTDRNEGELLLGENNDRPKVITKLQQQGHSRTLLRCATTRLFVTYRIVKCAIDHKSFTATLPFNYAGLHTENWIWWDIIYDQKLTYETGESNATA
jgi:hypothetical protein